MPFPSSQKEKRIARPWWVQFSRWLWKAACFLGTVVVLPVVINVLSAWFTNANGIIPATSFFGQLVAHWPLTVLVSGTLLLLAVVTWTLSREQVHAPVTASLAQQNRARMLQRLRHSYDDLLAQSLQGRAWLELGLSSKPDAVQHQTRLLLRMPNQPARLLPLGTSLLEVYDEAAHELLILGEPGAGKSTLLLSLARHLVGRAETDTRHPLPVILPLSSWAVKRSPLQSWLSEQLALIYDVPQYLAEQWVHQEQILPLLDGLDEVEASARTACIQKINAYHRDHLVPLVICSRTSEYEMAAKQEQLTLHRAVAVEPLTQEQVESYLALAGKKLSGLRAALKTNPVLRELATTPLMLSVLMLTYQGKSARSLPRMGSREEQQQEVFTTYVERMVECKGNVVSYPLHHTISWLSWLARKMREHSQTTFYLEHLRPDWLTSTQQHRYRWWAVRLPALLIGILAGLTILALFGGVIGPVGLLQYAALGGLLGWLFSRSEARRGRLSAPLEDHHRQGPLHRFGRGIPLGIVIGLIFGLSWGLALSSYYNYTLGDWLRDGSIYGVVMGISSLMLSWLLRAHTPESAAASLPTRTAGRWHFLVHLSHKIHGQRAWLVIAILGAGNGLSSGLSGGLWAGQEGGQSLGLNYGLRAGLDGGLAQGLRFGIISILVSLILAVQAEDITLTELLHWTRRSLLRSLLKPKHLREALLVATGLGLSYGLENGLIRRVGMELNDELTIALGFGLGFALGGGLLYWLLLGLFQGVSSERLEDRARHLPNQGVRRSLRNSAFMALISSGVIYVIGVLSVGLGESLGSELDYLLNNGPNYGPYHGLYYTLFYVLAGVLQSVSYYWLSGGLLLAVCGGLLVFASRGGLAVLRHYIIRLLLARSHTFPWQAIPFLEDATTRILLRRVGGGYSFAHRLLLDHFADTYPAASLEETAGSSPGQTSVVLSP